MIPRLLTVKEASERLRLSRNGLLRLVETGRLPVVRYPGIGNRAAKVLFREPDLEEFIEEHCSKG